MPPVDKRSVNLTINKLTQSIKWLSKFVFVIRVMSAQFNTVFASVSHERAELWQANDIHCEGNGESQ